MFRTEARTFNQLPANMDTEEREHTLKMGEEYCDQATQFVNQGDYPTALDYFSKAEEEFVKIQDQHWLNFLRHEKLRSLQHLEKYKDAIELTEKISEGYLATGNKHGLTLLLIHKADLLLEQNQIPEALESLRISETIAGMEGFTDLLTYINSNIAINLISQGNYISAIEYLDKNLESYSSDEEINECSWCLQQIGNCYLNIYNLEEADKYFTASYQGYFKANDHTSALEVVDQLKELYQNSDQLKKAEALESSVRQR